MKRFLTGVRLARVQERLATMWRYITVLLGFAVFGAIFTAAYYQPQEASHDPMNPKFRLAPGELAADFIEAGDPGESIQVNITVLSGGPIDVYVMDMENLTLSALNATTYTFELGDNVTYFENYTAFNVSSTYNFTFVSDGENRTALLIASRVSVPQSTPPENGTVAADGAAGHDADGDADGDADTDANATADERVPTGDDIEGITELAVQIRYQARETRTFLIAYALAVPSVLLVGLGLWRTWKKRRTGRST